MLFLHEMTHVLVFSNLLFNEFQNENNNDIITYKVINGINRTFLSTPKVIEYAKKHFNCDNITGIELENQESDENNIGNHWEARIMLGDYMISEQYEESVISDITLAVFEDSGWYQVN